MPRSPEPALRPPRVRAALKVLQGPPSASGRTLTRRRQLADLVLDLGRRCGERCLRRSTSAAAAASSAAAASLPTWCSTSAAAAGSPTWCSTSATAANSPT